MDKIFKSRTLPTTGTLVERLVKARGANGLLSPVPKLAGLIPVTSLTNAVKMAERLSIEITKKSKIVVVADYDSDGATACAVMVRCLKAFGANVDFIVPDREVHGYGLTASIVEETWTKKKPDIILTVDNGIASFDGALKAKEYGITVLVTDHHLPADTLPEVEMIVNPNQPNCTFPSKNLAGCGVAFYVMATLEKVLRSQNKPIENGFSFQSVLDLVALGTIADVVKLDENNRLIVKLGLERIRQGKACAGLQALLEVSGRDPRQINTWDFGFVLGPRLNAAGRISDMSIGIKCLLATDMKEAFVLAEQLQKLNTERKSIETDIKEVAFDQIQSLDDNQYTVVAYNNQWHQGVIGIVASRLKDKWYRPTFVFTEDKNGYAKGSGRSIQGLHLRDALDWIYKKDPTVLAKFGGHAMAAGASVYPNKIERFKELFEEACHVLMPASSLDHIIETDGELDLSSVTPNEVLSFSNEVWGNGFPEPLFQGVFHIKQQMVLKETHLRLVLEDNKGFEHDAIWFFQKTTLPTSRKCFAYILAAEDFRGKQRVRMQIRDAIDPPLKVIPSKPKPVFNGFIIENEVYF